MPTDTTQRAGRPPANRDHAAGAPGRSRELLIAVGATLGLTVALDALGYLLPVVRANLVALYAFVFLYVPQRTLPAGGPGPEAYGLTWAGARRGIAWGVALALLTFVGFLPGHHLWATRVLGTELHVDAGAYVRPDDRHHGEPAELDDGAVHVFHLYDVHYVAWSPTEPDWAVRVDTDGTLWDADRSRPRREMRLSGEAPRPVRLAFRTTGGSAVEVRASTGGSPVERQGFALGPGESAPRDREWADGAVRLPLSVSWLPLAVLFQLALIALPEEFFYRGYLQRRMDELHGRRAWRVGALELSRSNLVVSALFALGHFVVGFDPLRLAVFFPSLVFGWLRDRTDGLAAPIVYHAACNLMVQVVAVHYW